MRTHGLSCTGCEVPHFLKSCFLCHKPLDNNNDIFMYRGDTPFCSQEIDEGSEKNWSLSSSKRSATKPGNKSSASSKVLQIAVS
ncbi:hypothetical protein DCAR_0728738 [Daucus carota subsp. sativus]|uniref:FLZ-type domain-containing protein n=1 Tax=Daucus carota subsp. sativus TaxID=79200 RepID=A0AAF0XLJ1_DAUCS|nr:hypothetical protein DCAR_0728738 [Daucus carota subsp. sativus]